MSNLKKFIRDEILNFQEYKTVSSVWDLAEKFGKKALEIDKVDQGENFFGTSPKVKAVLGNYDFYNYYPDPEYKSLRKAIGKNIKVSFEKIMVGSGSDELIDLIFRLTLNVGDEVISFPPSFGMYDVSIKLNRGKVVNVPRGENYSINIKEALKAVNRRTKVIIVCSPNNPTGNPTSRKDIIKFLETGKLVMLDEAYAEYAKENNLDLVKKYPNLIVLRTFSKWAGIAGLRLGYLVMDDYLISQLMKIKSPFNVNLAAETAGIAILSDLNFAQKNIERLKRERYRLYKNLSTIPYLKVYPSETNFLFANVFVSDFEGFRKYLFTNQIIVRYFISGLAGNSIRITVGRPETNKRLFKILQQYKQTKVDGIIFDMDGVLIDVRKSCRLIDEKTVNFFLGAEKISQNQVNTIKSIPGFNNDWDASYVLLQLTKMNIPIADYPKKAKPLELSVRKTKLYQQVRRVWQTFYLGSDEFEKTEKKKAPFKNNKPYRFQEKLIVEKKSLAKLKERFGKFALATSRPRKEAIFALKQFSLEKYFDPKFLVGLEDAVREKPYPDPLLEARKRLGVKNPVYVGDTVNDYLAAKSAYMPFILIGKENYGDTQISSVDNLLEVLNA